MSSAPHPLDRCPYRGPFARDFDECPAYRPETLPIADSMERQLGSAITCAHLRSGEESPHRFYPRCGIGTAADRIAWTALEEAGASPVPAGIQVIFDDERLCIQMDAETGALALFGELDATNASAVEAAIASATQVEGAVVVSLVGITHCDPAGARAIVRASRHRLVRIIAAPAVVSRALAGDGFDSVDDGARAEPLSEVRTEAGV